MTNIRAAFARGVHCMRIASACLALAACAACAPAVVQKPQPLTLLSPPGKVVQVNEPVDVLLPTGYRRQIQFGTHWQAFATVPQGTVYRPVGDVFTIEGRHVHEADLVIDGARLVGFYLVAQQSFSALDLPVNLPPGAFR